jgi:hypothetical protein
MDNFSFL